MNSKLNRLNNKEVDNVDLNEVALNCHTTIEFRPNLCDPDYEQTGDLHLLTWFIGKSEMPFNASVPFHKEKMKYIFKEHQPNLKRSAYLLNSNSLFGDMSSGLNTVLIESVIQKFSESSYDYICER